MCISCPRKQSAVIGKRRRSQLYVMQLAARNSLKYDKKINPIYYVFDLCKHFFMVQLIVCIFWHMHKIIYNDATIK